MGATLRGRDATRPALSGHYELIRIGDISQDGTFVNSRFGRINPNQPVNDDLILRSGDVLFPNRGTRTTAATYRGEKGATIAGLQFFIIRPDERILYPEYLATFLRSEPMAKYFAGKRKGTYVQIIERKDLADIQIPLPSMDVQQRIVAVAELAAEERNLAVKLAEKKWHLINQKLMQFAEESISK
jgi:restriction endonuclease S subunit